ncbi:hypothetical protein HYV86_00815 [Candidatus Woesearchaeota archaeon]|nr:hypothetical protein [Candidatus Woesearchaeota archaeon]
MAGLYTAREALEILAKDPTYVATTTNADWLAEAVATVIGRRAKHDNAIFYDLEEAKLISDPVGLQRFWKRVTSVEPDQALEDHLKQVVCINGYVVNRAYTVPDKTLDSDATDLTHSQVKPGLVAAQGTYGKTSFNISLKIGDKRKSAEIVGKSYVLIGELTYALDVLHLEAGIMQEALRKK